MQCVPFLLISLSMCSVQNRRAKDSRPPPHLFTYDWHGHAGDDQFNTARNKFCSLLFKENVYMRPLWCEICRLKCVLILEPVSIPSVECRSTLRVHWPFENNNKKLKKKTGFPAAAEYHVYSLDAKGTQHRQIFFLCVSPLMK